MIIICPGPLEEGAGAVMENQSHLILCASAFTLDRPDGNFRINGKKLYTCINASVNSTVAHPPGQ